jgi:hypothetical protein
MPTSAATASAVVPWERCRCEDRGDGALVLIPPDVPKNLLAGPLPLELVAALEEHNAACEQQARIRLRAVLHAGEVRLDDYGAAGAAINLAFRLLESAALRSVLAGSPDVLALMASEWFFQEVIRHEPGVARPASGGCRLGQGNGNDRLGLCATPGGARARCAAAGCGVARPGHGG